MTPYQNLVIWIERKTEPSGWCFTITTKDAEELHVSEEYPTAREAEQKGKQWVDEHPAMNPNLIPAAWLNEAAGIKPTTAQRAADEIGDVWDLPTGPRDVIEEILKEIYGPLEQENQILREELASARMLATETQ